MSNTNKYYNRSLDFGLLSKVDIKDVTQPWMEYIHMWVGLAYW